MDIYNSIGTKNKITDFFKSAYVCIILTSPKMEHLDKTKKTLFHIKWHFETQTHTHVGLLVVVHRLDKNEITKVITHCKTGKQSSSPALIAPTQNKTNKK